METVELCIRKIVFAVGSLQNGLIIGRTHAVMQDSNFLLQLHIMLASDMDCHASEQVFNFLPASFL